MRILICGKGGSGKSTISSLLAKEIARIGNKVLVIDTDESNFGVHMQLGMDKPDDFMNYFGGKKVLFEKTKRLREKWKIDDLPDEYISEKGNVKLMVMGKIYDFGEGCACPINALASKFLEVLELSENEFLIADTDAGVEHFGRGVENGCDFIIAIIDPSRESILLAEKISKLGQQVNKPVYYVLNKVKKEIEKELLASVVKNRVAAIISENKNIFKANLAGAELDFDVKGINELANLVGSENNIDDKIDILKGV